ncbi:Integrase core domain containing protein [Dirofilaria immitis]|nr:Integrase core domain containing protein [Dirofilaria immitis]
MSNGNDEDEFIPRELTTYNKLIKYWSKTLETLDVFWKIWKDEYLNSLRERTQTEHKSPRGEVVLVNEPHIPRGMWKLAKINKLNKSSDENVRSVQIELPFGKLLNRPVNMLYPLEVKQEDQPEESVTELMDAKDEEPIARRTRSSTKELRTPAVIDNALSYQPQFLPLDNRTASKRWVALFTCLVTRAIRMEVMKNMSAEIFMQMFRRYISQRLPPEAPWQEGVYERMTGVVKGTLQKAEEPHRRKRIHDDNRN